MTLTKAQLDELTAGYKHAAGEGKGSGSFSPRENGDPFLLFQPLPSRAPTRIQHRINIAEKEMTSFSIKDIRNRFAVTSVGFACLVSCSGLAGAQQRPSMRLCVPDAGRLFESYVRAANAVPADVGQFFSQVFLAAAVNELLNASPKDAASSVEFEQTNLLLARGRRIKNKSMTCTDEGCKVRTTLVDGQGALFGAVFSYSSPIAECGGMLIDRWQIAVPQ